jgi:hypothetical protein
MMALGGLVLNSAAAGATDSGGGLLGEHGERESGNGGDGNLHFDDVDLVELKLSESLRC